MGLRNLIHDSEKCMYNHQLLSGRILEMQIEYSQVFHIFWGKRAFIFTQLSFFCCIMCLLIASIVDTAQVLDQIFAHREYGVSALRIVEGSIDIVSWKSDDCLQKEIDTGECM